jgi:hypothetical protein
MVASVGLIVRYERLKPDGGFVNHLSGDNKTFVHAAAKLESLLNDPFMSSCLWNEASSTWRGGKLVSVTGDPDSWDGLRKRRPISKDKKVGTVLKVIRDALAHGNIFTLNNPIETIIFIKANMKTDKILSYSFLSVAPQEFREFLENWFDFLNDLHISHEATLEILKDAA